MSNPKQTMIFTYRCKNYQACEAGPDTTITMQVDCTETSLPDILERFEGFLRSAGYSPRGYLEFQEDNASDN